MWIEFECKDEPEKRHFVTYMYGISISTYQFSFHFRRKIVNLKNQLTEGSYNSIRRFKVHFGMMLGELRYSVRSRYVLVLSTTLNLCELTRIDVWLTSFKQINLFSII